MDLEISVSIKLCRHRIFICFSIPIAFNHKSSKFHCQICLDTRELQECSLSSWGSLARTKGCVKHRLLLFWDAVTNYQERIGKLFKETTKNYFTIWEHIGCHTDTERAALYKTQCWDAIPNFASRIKHLSHSAPRRTSGQILRCSLLNLGPFKELFQRNGSLGWVFCTSSPCPPEAERRERHHEEDQG